MPSPDPDRFTPWIDATAAGLTSAPPGPAVVQIKVRGALLAYPDGLSAMVWYGALLDCAGDLPAAVGRAAAQLPERELAWRYLPTAHAPATLAHLLAAFVARFAAPPRLNAP